MPEFGKEMRSEFMFPSDVIQLNSGSYGACPKKVMEYQNMLRDKIEENPDLYFRLENRNLWLESLATVADFVGSKPENLAFVNNATHGVNAVLQSAMLTSKDALLASTWTYKPLQHCCKYVVESGAELLWLNLKWPIEDMASIIELYREMLAKHSNIKIALIDHITSSTAVVMPIKEIIELCHQHNVMVVVDGAHAPGQLHLNLEQLGADFYTGNLHKWLFAPRGCGILYVHPSHQNMIHSPLVSLGFKAGLPWNMEFLNQGTRDNSSCAASVKGIEFLKSVGGLDKVQRYNSKLLDKATDLLIKAWGTEKLPIPEEMEAPFMRLVKLPDMTTLSASANDYNKLPGQHGLVHKLRDELWHRYKMQSVILYDQGACWIRLCAHVFNSLDEYEKLAQYVLQLKNDGF